LVGVSKYVDASVARLLVEAGCATLGESRPQQLWQKAAALDDLAIEWHLIGHLQRNKVRRTLPLVALIHSIDSERLLREIDEQAGATGVQARCLLEANVSGDAAKGGFSPQSLPAIVAAAPSFANVSILGLMSMASLEGGTAQAEIDFERLRTLRDQLASNLPDGVALDELSMGMSGDFEAAIRQGATIVRVGSALFEGIER
jgi:hypothetical protein